MSVLHVGSVFHMYYEAWGIRRNAGTDYDSLQIGHATSPDGMHWTKDPANPVPARRQSRAMGPSGDMGSFRPL